MGGKTVTAIVAANVSAAWKREMRRALAQESFEEEIRKVGQLIQLSTAVKTARIREDAPGTKNASLPRASAEKASVESKL
jgi:hypothetical protein